MKKLVCFLLAAVMVLGLCACGADKEGDAAVKGLQVGYGREKIQPEPISVPLGGYGQTQNRIAQGFLDYLYVTCIAFREGENTTLLLTLDAFTSHKALMDGIRGEVSLATGLDEDRIMVAVTHTHSAPDIYSKDPAIGAYLTLMKTQSAKAAKAALTDLAPAQLYAGRTETERLNFIRHYTMNDGTVAGDNFGDYSSGYKGYAAENDPEIQLLKVTREGKKDIVLMNWQAHPTTTGGNAKTDLSGDYIAVVRTHVEAQADCLFAFFQGAAGNENAKSYIKTDHHNLEPQEFGQKLASYVLAALPKVEKLQGGAVRTEKVVFTYDYNHEKEDKGVQAREVVDLYNSTGSRDQGNALAKKYGLSSVYEAEQILARPGRPAEGSMVLYATAIGDFAFINAPYEMFSTSGLYIKEQSPFAMTFLVTLSNSYEGYFPTQEAFAYGCYESFTSHFARGVAEATAEQFVGLLESMK